MRKPFAELLPKERGFLFAMYKCHAGTNSTLSDVQQKLRDENVIRPVREIVSDLYGMTAFTGDDIYTHVANRRKKTAHQRRRSQKVPGNDNN